MKKLAIAALFLAFNAHADLYKCPSASGTSYQEKPCAAGGVKIDVEVSAPSQRADFSNAASLGQIIIGMTEAEVLRAWGQPDKVNRTKGDGWVSEQWIYGGRYGNQYLYLTNGVLENVQKPVKK
jgi:hypothetical protein